MKSSTRNNEDLVVERNDLLSWTKLVSADPCGSGSVCDRICFVLNQYQEQPSLLDSVLPSIVDSLLRAVVQEEALSVEEIWARDHIFVAVTVACKVRGAKYVMRFMPHDPLFLCKLHVLFREPNVQSLFHLSWHAHYITMLWLSSCMLIPFPLISVVQNDTIDGMYCHCLRAFSVTGKVSEGASTLLAGLVIRKDSAGFLERFISEDLSSSLEVLESPVVRLTALEALGKVLKLGRREMLLPYACDIMDAIGSCGQFCTRESLLLAKVRQRLALIILREHPCAWRYDRGPRFLFGDAGRSSTSEDVAPRSMLNCQSLDVTTEVVWVEEDRHESIIECIVDSLLVALQHRDTVVRWSAAKGIGRVTGRLPEAHADDIATAVLDLFTSPAVKRADSIWHGGCLCLAELVRRGLILPGSPNFLRLLRVVQLAGRFEIRRGSYSVGAHVRDAACFIIWSLARAYRSEQLASHVIVILNTTIPLALLDREINCRRAASAATQEFIGRHSASIIPGGLELTTILDYYALGDRKASYLELARQVAGVADSTYRECILSELWAGKLVHCDENIRMLAAKALGLLVKDDAETSRGRRILSRLLQVACNRGDILHRHGAVLGIAELIKPLGSLISPDEMDSLRRLPQLFSAGRYFKGRTGDMMRHAVCCFVSSCADADCGIYQVFGSGRVACEQSLELLEDSLCSDDEAICSVSSKALKLIWCSTVSTDSQWASMLSFRVSSDISAATIAVRQRALALTAGCLVGHAVNRALVDPLIELLKTCDDVEARRNACCSLGKLARSCQPQEAIDIGESLEGAMRDYAVDDRGDVGSWVREAGMTAFAQVIVNLDTTHEHFRHLASEIDAACQRAVGQIIRQCWERIDRTRGVAGAALVSICNCVRGSPDLSHLVTTVAVVEAVVRGLSYGMPVENRESKGISASDAVNFDGSLFADAQQLSCLTVPLFSEHLVRKFALQGLVAACGVIPGGGTGEATHWALRCIHKVATSSLRSSGKLWDLTEELVTLMLEGEGRLTVPSLVALEYVARQGLFMSASGELLGSICAAVRTVWKGRTKDVFLMIAAINLLCEIGMSGCVGSDQLKSSHWTACVEALVVVLGGQLPRLRRIAAEHMYVLLVSEHVALVDSDTDNCSRGYWFDGFLKARDLTIRTPWESLSVAEARACRDEICSALGIMSPTAPRTL